MIRLNLFMIWFLHFISLLSVVCRCYRQNSSSRIIVVLVYTVSTSFLYIYINKNNINNSFIWSHKGQNLSIMKKVILLLFLILGILPIRAQKVNFYFAGYCLAEEASPLIETTTHFESYKTVSFDLAKGTVDYPTDENTRCVSRIQKDETGVLLDEDGDPSYMVISLEDDKVISFNAYMGTFSEYNKMFLLGYDDIVEGYKFENNFKKLIKLMEQHGYKIHYSKEPE